MNGAIVLAAGSGKRMHSEINKPYIDLAGAPVLAYSLRTLAAEPAIAGIVIALRPGDEAEARRAIAIAGCAERIEVIVSGGAERQDSVRRALAACPETWQSVLIHDGARPLLSPALLARLLAAPAEEGTIPALPLKDSLKAVLGDLVTASPDRSAYVLVQTPQRFPRQALAAAHEQALADGYLATDDAELFARAGGTVRTVPGEARNLKITVAEDLLLAAHYLKEES